MGTPKVVSLPGHVGARVRRRGELGWGPAGTDLEPSTGTPRNPIVSVIAWFSTPKTQAKGRGSWKRS
jgi:hypothetical protein